MAVHQLKTRTLADKFANDVRASRRKVGRLVYMGLVVVTAVWLADIFAGPYLWLDAGGLVSADRAVISPPNDSQVLAMYASPGQTVRKGQVVALLESPGVTQAVANLKTRYADAAVKAADLIIRLNVAVSMEKVAMERLKLAEVNYAKLTSNRGYVSDLTVQASMQQRYDAQLEVAKQKAEREGAADQLHTLDATLEDAQQSIAHIQSRYNDGKVLAEDDGIVGAQTAQRGGFLRPGDPLMELFTGRPYVLMYLETNALYVVRVGDHVHVRAGFRETEGTVTEVRPIAVQLPPEFQKTFRPRGRGQVAKIELKNADFPLSTKVEITGDSYVPEDWVAAANRYVYGGVRSGEAWMHAFLEWLPKGWIKVNSIAVAGLANPVAGQLVAGVLAPVTAGTLSTVPTTVVFPAKGTRGMWVWTTEDILSDTRKTNIFIDEVRRSGVTEVYLYLTAAQVQKAQTKLRSLISTLRETNILVFGMEGWRGDFSDASGPAGLYEAVDAIARYDANVSSGERFVGFMSDLEPQDGQGAGVNLFHNGIKESALTSMQLADRDRVLTDWLGILQNVHDRAHAAGLRVAASLPSWTDNYYGEPVAANWRNRREDVTHFLMELVDDYCIMSYNTNPSNITNRILSKLKYANTLPRPPRVFGAVETHSGVGSGISYGDTAGKNTKAKVISDLDTVVGILDGGNPTFAGMNIHDWDGWRDLPTVSADSNAPYLDTTRRRAPRTGSCFYTMADKVPNVCR